MTPADRRRLEAIVRSIDLIREYASSPGWAADQRTVDAIAKRLEDIGEQASRLSEETLESMASMPWKAIIGMRARIVHVYEDLDPQIVQRTIDDDLPSLLAAILEQLGRAPA